MRITPSGTVESVDINPDGPEEIGGMRFAGGVMLCGVPDGLRGICSTSREDFARQMKDYTLGVGRGPVAVFAGADLNTFCGTFRRVEL